MASKAQELLTNIIIGVKMQANTFAEMSNMLSGLTDQIINFGKDSTEIYRDYEVSMTDAQIALATTYGKSGKDIEKVMDGLNKAAQEWAATTKFHTNDVANAIAEAAHANWDYEQIMAGMPAAIQLAYAGNLDLSEALDMIIKTSYAAGIQFDDMTGFIDAWAFAANSSATTVDEMGDAMLKMGSTMRWASNPEELLTMIAVLANFGTTGSQAGTMLRSSLMRLVAPTKKAGDAFAELGATTEEIEEVMGDEALFSAYEELMANGFQGVYDSKGKMRPVLDIYRELAVVLGDMAGGYDNIIKDEKTNRILGAIFPLRSIQAAHNLILSAANDFDGLYTQLTNGDAAGYGEFAASLMIQTLEGQIMTTDSKLEELKRKTGEALSEKVEGVLGWVNGVLDDLNGMDEGKFNTLVNGLSAIALTGTGLTLAASAMTLLSKVLTPAGAATIALTTITAAAAALSDLADKDIEDEFGMMNLDTQGIRDYIHGIGAEFEYSQSQVGYFRTQLTGAVEDYKTASGELSATLLESMLTGATLTEEDMAHLASLGSQMLLALKTGIYNADAASVSFWTDIFGGEGVAENDAAYQEIIALLQEAETSAIAEAESIGQDLRNAITKAWADDNKITPEEYQNILAVMRDYNAAIAKAAAEADWEESQVKLRQMLYKAQTASFDDVYEVGRAATSERDTLLQELEDQFYLELARLGDNPSPEAVAAARAGFESKKNEISAAYDQFLITLWTSAITNSDQGNNFATLQGLAMRYMLGDEMNPNGMSQSDIESKLNELMGSSYYAGHVTDTGSDREKLGKMLGLAVMMLGGPENIQQRIGYYEGLGNGEYAEKLRMLLVAEQLANNNAAWYFQDEPLADLARVFGAEIYPDDKTLRTVAGSPSREANARLLNEIVAGRTGVSAAYLRQLVSGDAELMEWLGLIGSAQNAADYNARKGSLSYNSEDKQIMESMIYSLQEMYDVQSFLNDIRRAGGSVAMGGTDRADTWGLVYEMLFGQYSGMVDYYRKGGGIRPPVDFTEVVGSATYSGNGGIEIPATIEPNDEELVAVIEDAQGTPVAVEVVGDLNTLKQELTNFKNQYGTINVTFRGKPTYAEGGRATSASIFGEAGPEWAIPEEHSERTAALLNAARIASGFTWPEILGRFGGLNASTNHQPTTIVYSPTINAADVTGVERALREDKRRLDKWYEERMMRDRVEVFA